MSLPERLERYVIRSAKLTLAVWSMLSTLPLGALSRPPSIIIDTTGQTDPRAFILPVLRFLLNGQRVETGIVRALWGNNAPQLGIQVTTPQKSQTLSAVRIAIPDSEITTAALDAVFRRLVPLLVDATAYILKNRPLPAPSEEIACEPVVGTRCDIFRQTIHGYLPKIARQFLKPFVRRYDWCIGYRRRRQPRDFPHDLDLRPETFTLLASPPSRFYADPFLFEHDGATFLFFEDYDYDTGKAHISYVILGSRRTRSTPALALERPYHLSYPYVFGDDGRDSCMIT